MNEEKSDEIGRPIINQEDLRQCDWNVVGDFTRFRRWVAKHIGKAMDCEGTTYYYVGYKRLETGATFCTKHAKIMERFMRRFRFNLRKYFRDKDDIEVFLIG